MGVRAYGWMDVDGYMEEEEFCRAGYLFEVNRQFFHPLGLQLVAQVGDDGLRLRIMDRRYMEAGLRYEPPEDLAQGMRRRKKSARVRISWEKRAQRRLKRFGWVVQPDGEL